MAKKWGRGGLQYVTLLLSDPALVVLNKIVVDLGYYYVLVQDAVTLSYSVYNSAKSFSQAYAACLKAGGSGPRCFLKVAGTWVGVNPLKMPH